jgi:TPR repeat protein
VRADDCQLVADIKARAELVKLPSYQFLWGDMLAWGVCVDKNAELGIYYIRAAARQGQPRALEQLGRYYVQGKFVQQDKERALPLFEQSAKLGFLPAKLQWAELLVQGYGSPYDYQTAYSYLYNTVTDDAKVHDELALLLARLAHLMPKRVVNAAKNAAKYQ